MSDADDQTGGSGDPKFDKPTPSELGKSPKPSPDNKDENDNDVMTHDDLPSGG
jgi:hypothetical protein